MAFPAVTLPEQASLRVSVCVAAVGSWLDTQEALQVEILLTAIETESRFYNEPHMPPGHYIKGRCPLLKSSLQGHPV